MKSTSVLSIYLPVFLALSGNVIADNMIYKCKSPDGAIVYKKAPCDGDADTVSTWTPKESAKPLADATANSNDKPEATGTVLKLKQHASGHYFTEGNVDGKPLVFVVDTGASNVSLSEKDAHDAQIYCDKNINMSTANGTSSGCTAKAKKVQFGPFIVSDTEIIIAPNLNQPLLGMNVLKLFKIAQENGEMQISVKEENKEGEKKPGDEKK